MNRRNVSKFALTFLITSFLVGEVAAAGIQRSGTITGPRGKTATTQGSGSCAGGSCSSQQSITGPNGRTATRNNSAQCAGGQCTTNHVVAGPNGRGFKRRGTITPN